VLGCPIDPIDMRQTVNRCVELIQRPGGCALQISVNAAKLVECSRNPAMAAHVGRCDLVNADGQAVVWASRLLRRPLPERVAGIDLMHELMARASRDGLGVFVLGARRDVLDLALTRIRERDPSLRIVGARDGWFTDAEEADVVAEIRGAAPDILFVAISSPRKEQFLDRHRLDLGARFAMGVGGSIDVIAGVTSRAPSWMQRLGLEWVYRFAQEPRRMWRRYLVGNARFAWLLIKQLVRGVR
jgi:N-acetylglucosaminyldiphosphoundecaprenol N-acetyl-beta-D-mannosaminyltransferase